MKKRDIKIEQLETTPPDGFEKKETKKKFTELQEDLVDHLQVMYAHRKHSLLIVLQGMDASGKDGTARKVFKGVSPTVIDAFSFKKPTEEEMEHDFLWRVYRHAPRKGHVQLFVRSHYEDILIQRVHKWIDMDRVKHRMRMINAFEKNLEADNGTIVMKFFLNISFDEQEEELQERIDDKHKNWKHNDNDWKERQFWYEYMEAYEDAINWSEIPWHIIPSDKSWYRDYLVTRIIVDKLKTLEMSYPLIERKK
ncbi:MAG: polyphosphate kinase [Saprospiraceae bacterium]|nr:polyphosphate kinase [Saprospiraceae bacterium]